MRVKYIGRKARKEDNVAGTGAVWVGAGDVQEVPDSSWALLSKHPDVWVAADDADGDGGLSSADVKPATEADPADPFAALYGMNTEALRKYAKEHTPEVAADGMKGQALRAAIIEALKAKA